MKNYLGTACDEAHLKQCDALTEGVVLYIQGDAENGQNKMRQALVENSPESLHAYAALVREIARHDVAAPIRPQMDELCQLLENAGATPDGVAGAPPGVLATYPASQPESAQPVLVPAMSATSGGEFAPAATCLDPADNPQMRETNTVVVAGNPRAYACEPLSKLIETDSGKSVCVSVAKGLFTITDLIASGDCADDLFVMSGPVEKPDWVVVASAGHALSVHAGRLVVGVNSSLVFATRMKGVAPRRDARCAITWSGYATPASVERAPAPRLSVQSNAE